MTQPTVYIRIGPSAIAYEESGEILETVDFDAENLPDWTGGGYCDERGTSLEAFKGPRRRPRRGRTERA